MSFTKLSKTPKTPQKKTDTPKNAPKVKEEKKNESPLSSLRADVSTNRLEALKRELLFEFCSKLSQVQTTFQKKLEHVTTQNESSCNNLVIQLQRLERNLKE